MHKKHHYLYPNQFFKFLIKVILCEILTASHVLALLPPPPPPRIITLEEQLKRADIVVVGVFDKYVFIDLNVSSNGYIYEYHFDDINRRRYAVVKLKRILYSRENNLKDNEIKIYYPSEEDGGVKWENGELIFIAEKLWTKPISNNLYLTFFYNIMQPIEKEKSEKTIRILINKNRQQSNK